MRENIYRSGSSYASFPYTSFETEQNKAASKCELWCLGYNHVWEYKRIVILRKEQDVFFQRSILKVQVLPSPERACPDIDGGGEGLEGKSDIMPCNLFLRFSEAGERNKTPSHDERRRKDGEAHTWTEETNVGRRKKTKETQGIPST